MKRFVLIMLLMLFAFGLASCDLFTQVELTTNETTAETTENITTTTSVIETTTEEVTTWSSLETQLLNIYSLAIEADAFDGTYEEWLESVRGPQGDNGEAVQLTLEGNFIKWKYESEVVWNDLILLDDLMGEAGVSITGTTLNESGELVITYSDESTQNLGRIISQYQVTFYDYNGYFLDSEFVVYSGEVTPPDDPEREGHTFFGWSEELTNIVSDMDVFAIYEVNTYIVSFDSNEGTDYSSLEISYGNTIMLPTPVREGYIFQGWFKGETVNDAQFTSDTLVEEDLTLYAKWILEVSLEDIENPLSELGSEIIDDFGGIPELSGMVYIEAVEPDEENDIAGNSASVDVAYKICEIKNDVLQQLSPWVSTDASEIVISTEKITSSTITAGISMSISTTIGATAGIPEVASASFELTLGITASLEYAVTQAQSSSLSITFPLDGLERTEEYAVFLTGSYEVYQVFSTDYLTGTVTDYIFVRVTDASVIRLLSFEDANTSCPVDLSPYKIKDFSLDNFKVSLSGEGTADLPYEIYTETDLYAMLFEPSSHYILMNDITIDKFTGLNGVPFTGVFDGQSDQFTISNFNLEIDPKPLHNDTYYGFFGIIEGGTVKDLKFSNPSFSYKYVEGVTHEGAGILHYGVLCGLAHNSAHIENVDIEYAVISNARYNAYIGGIVGRLNGLSEDEATGASISGPSDMVDCDVLFSKLSGCGYLGGVVGAVTYSTVANCSFSGNSDNYGEISFYSTGPQRSHGGIVGLSRHSNLLSLNIEYTELIMNGTITNTPCVGMIAGNIQNSFHEYLTASNVIRREGNITDKWYNIQHYDHVYDANNHKFGYWDSTNIDLRNNVIFLDWDGTVLQTTKHQTDDQLESLVLPVDPVREGYTFTGWDISVPVSMPDGDVTITAIYIINQYTIYFITVYYGDSIASITLDYGETIILPADPVSTDDVYTEFLGWFHTGYGTDAFDDVTMPANDVYLFDFWGEADDGQEM